MMDEAIESLKDKLTHKHSSIANRQFGLLIYIRYFHFHCRGPNGRSINWDRFDELDFPTQRNTFESWTTPTKGGVNYKSLSSSMRIFEFNRDDHQHLITSLDNELTVLLAHLKIFYMTQVIPTSYESYYSRIKYLNDKWTQSYASKSEIKVIDRAFAYMKSVLDKPNRFDLFNNFLYSLRNSENLVQPAEPESSIENHSSLIESVWQPNESIETYYSSQKLIYSQDSSVSQLRNQPCSESSDLPVLLRCETCDRNFADHRSFGKHINSAHRIISQNDSSICFNCKGFMFQTQTHLFSRSTRDPIHRHITKNGTLVPPNLKRLEFRAEENQVLAVINSTILHGYRIPKETDMIFKRYYLTYITLSHQRESVN